MKKIDIQIPDNLTEAQEIVAIVKQLNNKRLLGNDGNLILGNPLTIKDIQTQINITRVSKEKPIATHVCAVCNTVYTSDTAVPYWHNYGGNAKQVRTCSPECRDFCLTMLGDRAAKTKKGLKAMRFF